MKSKRIELLGVPVDCVDMAQALEIVDSFIEGDRCQSIIAVNPEKVIRAQEDPELLACLKQASLLIPDGIGVVLAARILSLAKMERVPGSELMPAICERSARRGYRVFLFGASPEVNERAKSILLARYPGLQIVGNQHGFIPEDQFSDLIRRINEAQTQILFVALGSPKQEAWLAKHASSLDVKVCQAVGGTLDVIAGRVRRAPYVMRRLNLEWLYRLLSQPQRIFRQTALPKFVWQVMLSWMRPRTGERDRRSQ